MFLLEESFYILQLAFKGKQVINIFNVRRPPDKKGFLYGLQNELHVFFNITTFSSSWHYTTLKKDHIIIAENRQLKSHWEQNDS